MDLISVNKRINNFTYSLINLASSVKFFLEYIKTSKYRKYNLKLKDIHKDQTCYIVGNGPSIKSMDLTCLSDKFVISVNKMICTSVYDVIKPQYHCITDRLILDQVINDINHELDANRYNTKFLLHRSALNKINDSKDVYFIYNTKLPRQDKMVCDLTKNASAFINVLPYAVMCAAYMGFKKIVLLGCDFSFFASRKDAHFYDVDNKSDRKESLYQDLSGCAIAITQYESLYKFCKKNNIELVNCTPNSLLDVIPQKEFKDYID